MEFVRFHEPGRTEQAKPIWRSTTGFQHRDTLLSLTVSASQELVWKAAAYQRPRNTDARTVTRELTLFGEKWRSEDEVVVCKILHVR